MAKGIKNVCKHGKVDMFKFVEKYELKWTGFVQTMDDGVMLATDLFSLIVTKDVRDIKDYRSTGAIGRTRGMVPDMAVAKCNLANCWPKETVTLDDNDRDMFVKELEFVKKQNISSKEGSEARVVFSSMYKGQVFKYPVVNNMIEFAKNGIESVEYRVLDGKTSVLVMKDKIGGLGLFMGLCTNEETHLLDGMDVMGTGFHNELLYIVVPSPYTQPTYKVHSKEELRWRIEREIRVVGKTGSLNHIDVSEITDFSFLFEDIDFNGDIFGWDVSNALTMRGMFINSTFNGDIAGWDVSNVTDMTNMFMSSDFNGDISGWDVSNVTRWDNMFLNSAYTGPDLSFDKPVEYGC